MKELFDNIVLICGLGHFVLCLASLAVPGALKWNLHLSAVPVLIRQMFWTYAGYILVINFWFGFISVFGTDELLNGSFLAKSTTFLIGAYWLGRVLIQFFYFDRSAAPKGLLYTLGELALIGLFVAFSIVYTGAFLFNMKWI